MRSSHGQQPHTANRCRHRRHGRDRQGIRSTTGCSGLAQRLQRADPSELPHGHNPTTLARYLFAINYGIAVHAAGGAGPDELNELVDTVLMLWPAPSV